MHLLESELETYRALAENWLKEHTTQTVTDIVKGHHAWAIAYNSGIVRRAYALGRDITDFHIQSALKRIFPNVMFEYEK